MTIDHHKPDAPVVALDIDGTLGKYHDHFIDFAQPYLGQELVADWKDEYRGEFNVALGLDKEKYREAKLSYRQGGLKRSMPVFRGASELTREIHRQGAQVWVCTTRPFLRLDNIDPDTREFLARNGIEYDGLLYGEDKYRDLVYSVGKERIVCVLDDLPEQILAAKSYGLYSILRTGEHNEWFSKSAAWHIASSLAMAQQDIVDQINKWKTNTGWDDNREY